VFAAAVVKMDAIMRSYAFTDPAIQKAAAALVEDYRSRAGKAKSLGHSVGLEVHDPDDGLGTVLEPGHIFTIEPQLRLEEEHLGIRLEGMLLITESGYENLSAFVPIEVKDIEKPMAEGGLSDAMLKPKQGY
jgi:Xaa-Pro aminopeptidase